MFNILLINSIVKTTFAQLKLKLLFQNFNAVSMVEKNGCN
jgi:hypothetical protein